MNRYLLLGLLSVTVLRAETGYNAWLRYAPLEGEALARERAAIPAVISLAGKSAVTASARDEIVRGVRGMLGRTLRIEPEGKERAILVGTFQELGLTGDAAAESYALRTVVRNGVRSLAVTGPDERGVLYGAFALLRKIAFGEPIGTLDEKQSPYAPIRWINQWDNLDGSIERGYGGRSIFWEAGKVREDVARMSDYGRLLASLGLNATTINNVNANPLILSKDMIPQIARIADAFRPWGVRIAISVDFGSPKSVGGLDTFDPVDPRVAQWWKNAVSALYQAVPDLAGFVLKADSEGRVGPSTYGRSHADAANVVARALKPHGGLLLYRGFVYDHHMDWNNPKNDRARAAYDNFKPLDGQFDENVVIQIKNGPIDFQVREPASPLFGALEKTSTAMELQVTQEYMGQAKHMVFLAPQWKQVLDFDEHAAAGSTPVKALAAGKTFHRATGGFVGVTNAGLSESWMGNQLSQANLYAFGRLAWNPDLTAEGIAQEWTRLTFGQDPKVLRTVADMQMKSWRTYENYTGPLGLQTLTDITGNHYGVAVEASERNGWGQWHRADEKGVGMDRSQATGTGYVGQYREPVAKVYESVVTCPDELLLFMHHVPYTHVLHSGKTVIQSLYDSHYEGAAAAEAWPAEWESLKGKVDDRRFEEVLQQLQYQAGQAQVWRDAVVSWFLKESGIPDAKGRAGRYPGRMEAEAASLEGYKAMDVTPWEAASGGKGVTCPAGAKCVAKFRYEGPEGWKTIAVQYFDQPNGEAMFRISVAGQALDEWRATDRNPARKIDASSSTRRITSAILLRTGDEIRIDAVGDGQDPAALDYIEIRN
jgi:alpha-glucuronidase